MDKIGETACIITLLYAHLIVSHCVIRGIVSVISSRRSHRSHLHFVCTLAKPPSSSPPVAACSYPCTHASLCTVIVYDGTSPTICNRGGRRSCNFQSTLPRAHYPRRSRGTIVCSSRFSELVSSADTARLHVTRPRV